MNTDRNKTIPADVSGLVYHMGIDALESCSEPYFTAFSHIVRLAFDNDRQPEDEDVIAYVTARTQHATCRQQNANSTGWHSEYCDTVLMTIADKLAPYDGNETADEIIAICQHPEEFYEYCTEQRTRRCQSRDRGLDSVPETYANGKQQATVPNAVDIPFC